MNKIFKIGIVDDDSSKITQIMIRMKQGLMEASPEKQNKYRDYGFNPVEITMLPSLQDTVETIISLELDCAIIDYRLSSFENIDFSGIDLANEINNTLFDFPIFILTSYEDELFDNEIFNAYQVFDSERYLNEPAERTELNFKIIEQILKYRKQRKQWEEELYSILPLAGSSEEIDSRLLELDSMLEKSINGTYAIPKKTKLDFSSNKLNSLIDKIDKLLEKE